MAKNLLAALASICFAYTCAAAYPDRPIRLVVPAAPGGAIDVVGRIMGVKFSEVLAQNIVIDNRAGANNIIGTEIAARSPADPGGGAHGAGGAPAATRLHRVEALFAIARRAYRRRGRHQGL